MAESTARGIEQYLDHLAHQIRTVSKLSDIRAFNKSRSEAILRTAHDDFIDEGINGIGMLDSNGILRFSANDPPSLIGTDFSYRNYFQEAMRTTSPNEYVTEFIEFTGADLGKKGVAIAIPIRGEKPSNTREGVIKATLPLAHVTRTFIEPLHQNDWQHAFLLDKRYSVLWSPDKSQFGGEILDGSKAFPEFQNMMEGLVRGKKGTDEITYRNFDEKKEEFLQGPGETFLFAYAPVSIGGGEWFIALWTPESTVLEVTDASIFRLTMIVGAAIFMIMLSAAGTSVWILKSAGRLQRLRAQSDALNQIGREINSTLDVDEIMQGVVKLANKAMGCDTTGIALIENDQLAIKYSYGLMTTHAGIRLPINEDGDGDGARVAKNGQYIVINDTFNDSRVDPRLTRELSIRSFLGVPLVIKGETVGTLVFHQNLGVKEFTSEDIDFAQKVGASVSIAFENAHLFREKQSIADTLQSALLVMPEQIPGLRFGHLYRSAVGEGARVGGDFCDLFKLNDHLVGIVIGDVSGEGARTASVVSMIKYTIRAFAHEFDSPAKVLAKTNDLCGTNLDSSVLATAWYGVLDTESKLLVYSGAGHPPPLIRGKDGPTIVTNEDPNLPLGVLDNAVFKEGRHDLKEEEIAVLFTDGILVPRRDRDYFGEEELASLIDHLGYPLITERLPSLIIERISQTTELEPTDDVSIITISLSTEAPLISEDALTSAFARRPS